MRPETNDGSQKNWQEDLVCELRWEMIMPDIP